MCEILSSDVLVIFHHFHVVPVFHFCLLVITMLSVSLMLSTVLPVR